MLLAVVEDYDGGELLNNICWVRLMKFLLLMREEGLTGEWREGGETSLLTPSLSLSVSAVLIIYILRSYYLITCYCLLC